MSSNIEKLVQDTSDAANKEFCEHFLPDLSKQYPASWIELCRVCYVEGAKYGASEGLVKGFTLFLTELKDKTEAIALENLIKNPKFKGIPS